MSIGQTLRRFSSLAAPPREGDILASTRLLAALIIPFLAAAAVILLGFTGQTEELFAWGIMPPITSFALGAAYLSGVVFFIRVVYGQEWEAVAAGFPPVFAFASLLGIATVIHWDRFNHDHIAFWTWALLYFITPFLVLGAWLLNGARHQPGLQHTDLMTPQLRVILVLIAAVTGAVAAYLFLVPGAASDTWPWALSPLTAQVMAATFLLPALLHLGIALDGRWRSLRVPFEAQAFALAVLLVSVLRAWDDFDDTGARAAFLAGLAGLLVFTLVLLAYCARLEAHRTGRRAELEPGG